MVMRHQDLIRNAEGLELKWMASTKPIINYITIINYMVRRMASTDIGPRLSIESLFTRSVERFFEGLKVFFVKKRM